MPGPREAISIKYPDMVFPFQATNIPDAAGNAKTVEPSSNEYRMLKAGNVIGLSVQLNAALSTGTLTFRPTIGGTADTDLTVTLTSAIQGAVANVNIGKVPFAANALLGVDWTKTGTISPTTLDATIYLLVEFDDIEA